MLTCSKVALLYSSGPSIKNRNQTTASKYGQRILRVRTLPEIIYLDVVIPIAIIVTACVPEIFVPEADGGNGEYIMTAVHSGAAAIVCVVSPIIFTLKAIPNPNHDDAPQRPPNRGCAASLCQSNAVLASYGDVLLSCGSRPLLHYHWGMMVVLQTLCVGLFVIFFSYNELYAAYPRQKEHIISFSTEFTLVTCLFLSFLIITRLEGGASVARSTTGEPSMSGDRVAVTVRDSNGGGNGGAIHDHDEEVARGAAQSGEAGANGSGNGHAQQPPQLWPATNGNTAFAQWVQRFTNRVSIGE